MSTLTETFRLFDATLVSDALDEHGIDGVITGLDPAHPEHVAVGRAHPLRLEEAAEPESGTNFPYAMLEEIGPDRLLVLDGAGPEISCWGANASRLAAAADAAGIVVDGGYRDVPEVRASAFPLFGRGRTPRSGQGRLSVEAVGEPVEIGGVEVAPDDLIVADATGVSVVPAEEAAAVAETAEAILTEELLVEAKIDAGATVSDLKSRDHEF